ncbi:replication protein P [Marinagarivorans algicola]|uniref:replication protein P n=1 Tax=Marinagarivorans algicola TaxID=1513270 RepID=UPI000A70E688|nr:replication protein P [Marinagarivorans algicola]
MKHSLPTEAGQTNPHTEQQSAAHREQRIDAINQVFALFRLNYHAQFFKAYTTEGELVQVKKLWMSELERFTPNTLLLAAKAILETSDFLPTLHTMIRQCEAKSEQAHLPDVHTAYLEACRAPSPKINYAWSHPAIYHAGKACDWYFLQSSSESIAYPVFKRKYQELCERVRGGETLTIATPPTIEHNPGKAPSKEENLKHLAALRASLDL